MTLDYSDDVHCRRNDALVLERSSLSQSSISSGPVIKFHNDNSSVIKVGAVKVRFTQNFKKNDCINISQHGDAAKLTVKEERHCCGVVPWYPSRIPLAIYANNRCRISLSRKNSTDGEQQNFMKSPVSRFTSAWTETVAPVRSSLVNCFGKRETKYSSECDIIASTPNEQCAFLDRYSKQKCFFKSSPSVDCMICDCDEYCLISGEVRSTESTLDRFQKFRFGGDRTGRNNAARRGSGGSHKKKAQRSSDKSVNLKKLTDKLKQSSPTHPEDENAVDNTASSVSNRTEESVLSNPNQILIPLKTDDIAEDKNDIFEGVNLKLSKPESRTIVGSYYQRSIPFRSASFSQVFYSPEDRKYLRNNSRKLGTSKRNVTNSENSATLPRVNASTLTNANENEETTSKYFYSFSEDQCNKPEKQAASDGDCPKSNGESVEQYPAESLKSLVVPVVAPEQSNTFPQPPKRTKYKHKHRHRPCGRLYFSDENIFTTSHTECSRRTCTNDKEPVNHETIAVTITTPPDSEHEKIKNEANEPVVEVYVMNEETEQAQQNEYENDIKETKKDNGNSEVVAVIEEPKDDVTDSTIPVEAEKVIETNPVLGSQSEEKLTVDISTPDLDTNLFNQTSPSSPEEVSKPQWPIPVSRDRKLTPQTSTERDDEPEYFYPRKYPVFSRGDSYSEAESDQGDKCSVSPGTKEDRLSPLPYNHDLSDSDSRKSFHSPVLYSKRPLRGPYLEMIVNEQKKPENAKGNFKNMQLFDSRFPPSQSWMPNRAVDDYYLRRSNTSPHSNKLNVVSLPKRKISANIPFSSPASLQTTPDDKTLIHHQRTTSSPSQLEYYPDQLASSQHPNVPSQQLLHQLLRGSSERSLQEVDVLNKLYPTPTYKDTRSHIVVELYDTERSYVESLQILVTKYLQPLKSPECSNLIEPYVVEEIFYKIPEILAYHEMFLEELRIRLEGWNKSKCIGDIFLETFTKPSVIDAYIAFINNWKTAKESIKQTCHMKPAFARFLEALAREHKGKLALDSLLIMPVQRIPRYELLIQSLLKHTEICHPDYDKLQEALRQVHELAIRINCTERDSLELEQIENLIDGLGNLVTGDRTFLRYDLVTMTSGQGLSRKERALFLFNDLLIITSVKRRSSTVKKPILSSSSSIASSLESNKYKLLMKIPLEHLDIVKVKDENLRRMMKEMEYLTEDVNTLSQMVDLVATLHCPHTQLEENIREMLGALNKQLNERHVSESQLSYLELALNTRNSVENISVIFPKSEKRTNWEETFLEAKARLNVSGDRRLNPEFLTSVPIRKTRAGLQFTCAAASCNQQDVWVCNSDGYVGQVCILSLNPEPAVTSCNGVCNARILSVTSVPVSKYIEKCQDTQDTLCNSSIGSPMCKSDPYYEVGESIPIENLERDIPDIHLDSSSSSDEDDDDESSEDQKDATENLVPETVESTMWLGTEDGVVHIYNCADSLRIKRNRLKIQHNSAVYCILYVDRNVFVSLANGDVYVYTWCANYGWNTTEPVVVSVGCVTSPVSRMFLVCGKLWCISHNIIKILNISTLRIENSFTIVGENNRAITSVAVSGFSVYLSLQNSAVLRVVHGISCDILFEVNIAPAVTKMLSGTDDIIRQHKAACLRVTSLLACKELLWIGTSAGVILTMPLPNVKQNTIKISSIPHPVGLPHGHTGHVRFLTAVKCHNKMKLDSGRRSSKTPEKKLDPNINKMLIISGGDGYEDFRSSSVSEIAGREDSTNHLLIWRF